MPKAVFVVLLVFVGVIVLGSRNETAVEDPAEGWSDPELLAVVRKLKPREQQIVFLRVFEDLSFREIGQAVGIKESAAKVAFHRSIQTLRDALGSSPEEDRGGLTGGPAPLLRIDLEGDNYAK